MKEFLKRIFGITKIEASRAQAQAEADAAAKLAAQKLEELRVAALTPKERATEKGEPWVAVLDTHVNKENIRNGFFELDWNDQFIIELKKSGYGYDGDPDEEIVDRWFRDLAANMLAEAGQDPGRSSAGFVNVTKLGNNRAEIE